jgi:Zn-dependent metalloprotease
MNSNKAAFNLMTARDSGGRLLFDPPTVAALFYLTLTQRLSRTSGFSDSRRGITLTAQTLFRNESEEVRNAKLVAIAAAFDAVGITA